MLHRHAVRLVFVGSGTPEMAETYLKRYAEHAEFPGELLCDPHKSCHTLLDFHYGVGRSLFRWGSAMSEFSGRHLLEAGRLAWRNFALVNNDGDVKGSWIQGGTLALRGGAVCYLHREETPVDHRPLDEVLLAVGIPADELPKLSSRVGALDRYLGSVEDEKVDDEDASGSRARGLVNDDEDDEDEDVGMCTCKRGE
eukprot:gnl/TRDRNA2_/TRDRNA2_126131_c0_seq1.p1 gnl/TRDRNA2_/TRDRNA2_126131_c0~~gnl/TRDRNA2_/TRDRNA2_126131_c0_seq1.p1  ORF type:complete len:197 (-),score=40.91 gnl/TRDRNA2_/TRDRNA2_126131_c0_seq1:137-727(-)